MTKLLKLLINTVRLDVFDLSYVDSDYGISGTHAKVPFWTQRSAVLRVLIFVKHLLQAIVRRGRRPWFGPRGRVLFFYFSANQHTCMSPIAERVPGSVIACADVFNHGHKDHDLDFPLLPAYLAAIPWLPLVLFKYLFASGYHRKSFRRAFDTYWLSYGFYVVATWWLVRLRPAALVVANDHCMWTRAAALAAQRIGITTIYMQHACVTENFPPLSCDYALLDGQDALEKYTTAGPASTTRVYLIGMPKFDSYARHVNDNLKVTRVGLCLNKHDLLDRVREVCRRITSDLPQLSVTIRPHPSDPRPGQWAAMAQEFGLDLSHARSQGPFDFLQTVDTVIAGESSILLEAALINVVPIYYDFPRAGKDWYGFSRNGLAQRLDEPDQLIDELAKLAEVKPNVRTVARRYCTTVGTPLEGRSSQLAADLIRQIIKSTVPPDDQWASLHTTSSIQAFVPVAPGDTTAPNMPRPVILQSSPPTGTTTARVRNRS